MNKTAKIFLFILLTFILVKSAFADGSKIQTINEPTSCGILNWVNGGYCDFGDISLNYNSIDFHRQFFMSSRELTKGLNGVPPGMVEAFYGKVRFTPEFENVSVINGKLKVERTGFNDLYMCVYEYVINPYAGQAGDIRAINYWSENINYSCPQNVTDALYLDLNETAGIGILTDGHITYADDLVDGVTAFFSCDQNCEVLMSIQRVGLAGVLATATGSFSGGTSSINLDEITLAYQQNYEVNATFTDVNNPAIEFFDSQQIQYWYDSTPEDYQIGDFIFNPFLFDRLDFGFEISNLDVNIGGGTFTLYVEGPNGVDTGLRYTQPLKLRDGEYGSGITNSYTGSYHQWAGEYDLLIAYNHASLDNEIYPYGIDKLYYTIDTAYWESKMDNPYEFDWDFNADGEVSIGEFLLGSLYLIKGFFINIWDFGQGIIQFFKELMEFGQVDRKDILSYIIPGVHAEVASSILPEKQETGILNGLYSIIYGFVLLSFLFIILISIFLFTKKGE